jgi:dTDP-3-amino-3,4,6-trideoxy-alpha-D-glucose transaminase
MQPPDFVFRHDLVPEHERLSAALQEAFARVLRSGRFILGEELRSFEAELAAWVGRRYAVGVASGTDALALALRAAGLEPGDEVITASYAPTPTPAAIVLAGGRPVFADVEPETGLIDPAAVAAAVTPRTRFVIPIHLFGLPCDMARIQEIADRHGLTMVEDAAQAIGSEIAIDGGAGQVRRAGALGDISCLSFYPTKNLGACGDGGMVLTDRPDWDDKLRLLRNYGKRDDPFESHVLGVNSRLDELQAALLRAKLPHLAGANAARAERVARYRQALQGLPLRFLAEPPGRRSNHHILTVLCGERRDELAAALLQDGIQTNVYYPRPLPRMAAYLPFVPAGQEFPGAEALSRQALALPLYPELALSVVDRVCQAIHGFFARTT